MRRTRGKPERKRTEHGQREPPLADCLAVAAAHRCSDVVADVVTEAHASPAGPDGRASDGHTSVALADFHHDDRSCVLPDADGSGGEVVNEPTLVPVLRTVPRSAATATAAMKALLAGPSAKERAPGRPIETLIPAGTKLLGIEISGGLATVDLSAEFASMSPDDAWDLGSYSLHGRVAQVVYTLTQFTTVDRVNFKLDGKPVKVLYGMPDPETGASETIAMDKPVTRATNRDRYSYRDHFLPLIFVDRPAWGAALPNPGRVTGLANVNEAQFRITVLDGNDKALVDAPVVASCGTGCWGRFDVTLSYDVPVAQWGTLRVWDISEYSGRPVAVREYPVYLRPAP